MGSEHKAGSLIISQIGMFNEAAVLFESVILPAFFGGIDLCIKNFANQKNWLGVFDLSGEESNCWLAPKKWNEAESEKEPECKAWFAIDTINDNDDYWTALFCGQASKGGEAGIMFDVDPAKFGGRRACNAYFREIDPSLIDKLAKKGFKNMGRGQFFLPVRLDSAKLASAWEDNEGEFPADDECFSPLLSALETIQNSWMDFNAIVSGYPGKP